MGSEKIKVAQIVTGMNKGESSDIVRALCRALSSEYELWLIYGDTRDPDNATKEFLGGFTRKIYIPVLRREINPFYDSLALFQLGWALKCAKFDIVHTHTSKAGLLGRLAAKWSKTSKIIHTPHGDAVYRNFSPALIRLMIVLERFAAGFTDMIVASTDREKKDLLHFRITQEAKITIASSDISAALPAENKIVNALRDVYRA